jgi:DNA-binding transcriptional regulator YdaS (Cro superfamily)
MGCETVEGYKVHPAASVFPMMEGVEFDVFVKSVRDNGLRQPITLFGGLVLDGRNRLRACKAATVEPRFVTFEGGDPVAHVVALNLTRRHMSESQRAMVAAKIATLGHGRPRKERTSAEKPSIEGFSQDQAAAMLNVSRPSVERAVQVIRKAVPEAVAAVERGTLAVSSAVGMVDLEPDQQRELLNATKGDGKKVRALLRVMAPEKRPGGRKSRATPEQLALDERVRAAWEGAGSRSASQTAGILGIKTEVVHRSLTRMGLNTQARRSKDPLRGLVENARSAAFSWEQLSRGGPWESASPDQRQEAIAALEEAKKRAAQLIRKMRAKDGHAAE